MNFFRMHRHYVAADGVACDLLVIIQDFGSLNRFLRGVCELVLVFNKLKVLGNIRDTSTRIKSKRVPTMPVPI